MTTQRSKWFLAGLLCLALWSAHASAHDGTWQSYIDGAVEAYVEGDYAEARKQFERAVKTAEAFGSEDPRLATSLNGLAETYRAQGRYAEAEPLHKRVLAIREKALGLGHPNIVQSLNNLAGLYHDQGMSAKAEPLLKRVKELEAHAAAQSTLWQSHMASGVAAYQQGNYAEADMQLEAGLKIAEGFGPQDGRLGTTLDNLGSLRRAQGKYAQAEPLYQRSLAILEKALGPEHPDVATSLNNVASIYQAQGRYAEAEPLYQRSLAIYEKALGPEHPELAQSLENYAALLRQTARADEAERMEARAKAIRAKSE